MDRLLAMRSFIEVASSGSFTQTAEKLGVSRLLVSRHVQLIESWLKQRLLHRTTRKVSLTQAGEEALKRCERILDETAALEVSACQQSQVLSGKIRIASPIGLAQNLLAEVISDFTEINPEVSIEIVASDSFSLLVDERIDIALRYTTQPDESLIARKLISIDFVVCASPGYLQKHSPPKNPEQLLAHNCLVHLGIPKWEFIKNNNHCAISAEGNIKANDIGTLIQFALKDKGIMLLPCDLATPLIVNKQLVPLLEEYTIPSTALWAVYLSRSYQLPVVRQFIDYVSGCWDKDIKKNR
jgi:DNA-binding transcriptional LysR family regulator